MALGQDRVVCIFGDMTEQFMNKQRPSKQLIDKTARVNGARQNSTASKQHGSKYHPTKQYNLKWHSKEHSCHQNRTSKQQCRTNAHDGCSGAFK